MGVNREVNISLLMKKLRHGILIIRRMNWNSASGVRFTVAGLLGVAGIVLALSTNNKYSSLTWLPDQKTLTSSKKKKLGFVPGLQNLGNNCFLNVILQALASCLCFRNYLQMILEECESLTIDERIESVPLMVSLAALFEELCTVQDGRKVLSPRKVMLAMNPYIPKFNLTSQQDAAEAFLHLITSLREEFAECYVPTHISLADISEFPQRRILTHGTGKYSEKERWQQHYLGPFDGILGSVLSCQSCSLEIMMDFEFFHTLPLLPVCGRGGTIMAGCTVEDCLRRFIAAEKIDNYWCSNCWHIAAVKYLHAVGGTEEDICNVQSCGRRDSCGCREIFQLQRLPWSNNLSRTFKQLSISRCPKTLCIHLQRASMNQFGEMVKLQGHINFPLVLNLSPFIKSVTGIRNLDAHTKRRQDKRLYTPAHFASNDTIMDRKMANHIYKSNDENACLEQPGTQESNCTTINRLDPKEGMQAVEGEFDLSRTSLESGLEQMQTSDEMAFCSSSNSHVYQLVSVVEHFGRPGSGHYTAYRRVNEDHDELPESANECWFSVSDSDVCSVSEQEVLGAEASLLFYERIS